MRFLRFWCALKLWKKIIVSLILGALLGLFLGPKAENMQVLGILFINALHMIVAPVVFTSIVCAVLSLSNLKDIAGLGGKVLIFYGLSMIVAIGIGILVASIFSPGIHFHPTLGHIATSKTPSLTQMISEIIPRSPLNALADEHILQIIVFALLLGISIRLAGEPGDLVKKLFISFSEVVFKLSKCVISLAPYGIFGLIAWTFGHFGTQALLPLGKFVLAVYTGCLLQILLVYVLVLYVSGLSPSYFFKAILPALTLAFTTSSSAATLPLSLSCAEQKLGIDSAIARFLLPLGTSFNLNGLSIYLTVSVIFAANMYGITLSLSQYITLGMSVLLTALGVAAVPGSALIVMSAVMSAVGVPLGGLALIAGVDRLNDMAQTTTNVAGDLFATTILSHYEKRLNKKLWKQ